MSGAAGVCVAGAVFLAVSLLGLARMPAARPPALLPTSQLKRSGWVLLAVSLFLAVTLFGGEQGTAFWFCVTSLAGVTAVYAMARMTRLFRLFPLVFATLMLTGGAFYLAGSGV